MKYFGNKSLSSVINVLLKISWYVVLIVSIVTVIIGAVILFAAPVEDSAATGIAKMKYHFFNQFRQDNDWQTIRNLPVVVRLLFLPYFAAVFVLLLQIIRKSQKLFTNFKNDLIFNKTNVSIIAVISKLLIAYSIITFNFSTLLVSIILIIICEIFKNGTALQEEHDLTI
jgi:ammonia channel protein AmtB